MKCERLDEVKKDYAKFQKEYKLPSFEKLGEVFDIESVADKETNFLIREIRKSISEKVTAYMRFAELLINPTQAPMLLMSLLKGLSYDDKKNFENIYTKLGRFELDIMSLDNIYSEKDEAQFIKSIFELWKEIQEDMDRVITTLKRNWETASKKQQKDYFG